MLMVCLAVRDMKVIRVLSEFSKVKRMRNFICSLSKGIGKGPRQSVSKREGIIFWTIRMSGQEMIIRGKGSQNWVLT